MNEHPKKKDAATQSPAPAGKWVIWGIAAVLVLVTWIVFSPVLANDFVLWDDNGYVFQNDYLNRPLPEAISYFFGLHYFIGNYHPVTMTVYALLHQWVGTEPSVFHTANLVIHVLNVLLVFWWVWLLSNKKLLVAAITALFFGIHPMHVESVAWVAELKDVLYSFFFLAGLIAYLGYIDAQQQNKRIQWLCITFLLFLLSALSKPAGIIFPLALPVLDFYKGRKLTGKTWLAKIPFFLVSLVLGTITVKAQQAHHLVHDYFPFYQRLLFASYSLLGYIAKMLAPVGLANFYPYPSGNIPVYFYAAPMLVAAVTYGVYRSLKYTRIIAFGFLFYLVTLLLELQLISVGDAIMADRYSYVPYIGLLFVLASGIDGLLQSSSVQLSMAKKLLLPFVLLVAITFGYLAYSRCKVWRNSETIATDLYSKYPETPIAAHNLAAVRLQQGKFTEAIPLLRQVLHTKKDYVNEYANLASAYLAINELDSAFDVLETAMKYATQEQYAAYRVAGESLVQAGSLAAGAKFLTRYASLVKNDATAWLSTAECYYRLQDSAGYEHTIDSGLRYCPDNFNLLNHKGYSLMNRHKYAEAIPFFEAALKSNPGYEKAAKNLKECRMRLCAG